MPGYHFKNGAGAKGICKAPVPKCCKYQGNYKVTLMQRLQHQSKSGNTMLHEYTTWLHVCLITGNFGFLTISISDPLSPSIQARWPKPERYYTTPTPNPMNTREKNNKENTHLTITSDDGSCENGRTKEHKTIRFISAPPKGTRSRWIAQISTSKLGGNTISP